MAEQQQNKPKIDLRARLGKKTVGTAGPSIPPPMATGASIPAPPFVNRSVPPPAAAEPERPRYIEPQAIKIEMSEEVMAAQKKGKTKIIMMASACALIGGLIGIAFGGGMERGKRQEIALEGAKLLGSEVDKANAEIEKLAAVVAEAKRALSDGEYPEKQISELADIGIPFDGTYLVGKGTGLMSAKVNLKLIEFASKSSEANEQKDKLQRVLSGARKGIEELLSQKDKPKFNWSIYMVNGPHGPMAAMQPLPEPFLISSKEKIKDKDGKMVDYAWPDEFEVADGAKKTKLKRYKDGNPIDSTPMLIPVDPSSQAAVCANDTMVRLRDELVKLEELLKGDKSDPSDEKTGLVDLGQGLIDELKQIGMAG